MKILLFVLFLSSIHGKQVDIVSSFDIDHLPTKLPCLREEFNVSLTHPLDYQQRSLDPIQKILVLDPYYGGGREIFPKLNKEKLVLVIWEPHSNPPEIYDTYSRVYTWDDHLIDHVKFFPFRYPYLMPYKNNPIPFSERKLSAMVVGNWTEERLKVVRFFSLVDPASLDCYGRHPPMMQELSMYKGPIAGLHSGDEKIQVLQNYRFSICFENTVGLDGYITEKIFSCFAAGSVPVYLGPGNIEKYIPKSCFIDYRDFKSDAELYQFLTAMSEETHQKYIEAIKLYLKSDEAQIFAPKSFDLLLYEAATE